MTLEGSEHFTQRPAHDANVVNGGIGLLGSSDGVASIRALDKHDSLAPGQVGLTDNHVLLAQLGMPSTLPVRPNELPDAARPTDVPVKTDGAGAPPAATEGPDYNPDKWNAHPKIANCYVYAMNDFDPKYNTEYTNMDPGALDYGDMSARGGKALEKFANVQIAGAEQDGLHWTGTDPKPAPGSYKVALFVKPAGPYEKGEDPADDHWLRQDSDGSWSHKMGATPVKNVDDSGNKISDPSKANLGKYIFVGYFDVPKGGIKLHRNEDDSSYVDNKTPKDLPAKSPPMPEPTD